MQDQNGLHIEVASSNNNQWYEVVINSENSGLDTEMQVWNLNELPNRNKRENGY